MPRISLGLDDQRIVVGTLRVADAVIVACAGFIAFFLRHGFQPIDKHYLVAIAIGALLAGNFLQFGRLYRFETLKSFAPQFGPLTASWLTAVVTLLLIAYFGQLSEKFSRFWGIYWFVTAYIGLVLVRVGTAALLQRWQSRGRLTYNIVVVGAGPFGERLLQHLDRRRDEGLSVVGLFDDRKTRIPPTVGGYDVLGTVDDLLEFARDRRIDQIVIALPWLAEGHLREIMRKLQSLAVDVTLCPATAAFELPNMGYESVGGVPMLTIQKPPLSGRHRVLKNLEDRALALLTLLVVGPLMLLAAAAIRLTSSGPVFLRMKRFGFDGEAFTVLKFRTTRWTAGSDGAPERESDRLSPIGQLLRRTGLSDLLQLFNVLRGDMSLVGPEAHPASRNEELSRMIDGYLVRHRVKPGMTGWAQVNGMRGDTGSLDLVRRRVQYDLDYIENWSLLFDLKILLLTFFSGFVHEPAHRRQ